MLMVFPNCLHPIPTTERSSRSGLNRAHYGTVDCSGGDDGSSSEGLDEMIIEENNTNNTHNNIDKQQLRRNIPLRILQAANHDVPLFGLPNFCVYLFPTFLAAKQAQPDAGVWA